MVLTEFDEGLERNQVGKGIRRRRGDQILLLPALQLPLAEPEFTPDLGPAVFLRRSHANILAGGPLDTRTSSAFRHGSSFVLLLSVVLHVSAPPRRTPPSTALFRKVLEAPPRTRYPVLYGATPSATRGTPRARHGQPA